MANQDSFVHLHVHTDYSMLDGAAKIKELIKEVAKQEMPAVAMTDHGNMHGAYEFYQAAMLHRVDLAPTARQFGGVTVVRMIFPETVHTRT
jgi:DNA polymerase III alpha subunit